MCASAAGFRTLGKRATCMYRRLPQGLCASKCLAQPQSVCMGRAKEGRGGQEWRLGAMSALPEKAGPQAQPFPTLVRASRVQQPLPSTDAWPPLSGSPLAIRYASGICPGGAGASYTPHPHCAPALEAHDAGSSLGAIDLAHLVVPAVELGKLDSLGEGSRQLHQLLLHQLAGAAPVLRRHIQISSGSRKQL